MSSERGATAVEYAIMASLIGAVVVTTVTVLGTRVAALFQSVLTAMGW
ncbi:Flp family type IVb pilin [Tessaracoccus sp. MC1627]|nr:Flp family type IVb pilin [Tessaracoccus sp. MC1627]MBB1513882.1 Flp family type IVb pilin [Tessaracoccus sp. MC1627]MBB1513892.1 Flp family type IVb pilin [Tessaracoccus sp. MC1627]